MRNNLSDYDNEDWGEYCFYCNRYVSFSHWNKFYDKCDYCLAKEEENE